MQKFSKSLLVFAFSSIQFSLVPVLFAEKNTVENLVQLEDWEEDEKLVFDKKQQEAEIAKIKKAEEEALILLLYKHEMKINPERVSKINKLLKCARDLVVSQLGKEAIIKGFSYFSELEKAHNDIVIIEDLGNKCEFTLLNNFEKFYHAKNGEAYELKEILDKDANISPGTRDLYNAHFFSGDQCLLKVRTLFATYRLSLRLRLNYGSCISNFGDEYNIQTGRGIIASINQGAGNINGFFQASTISFRLPSLSKSYILNYGPKIKKHILAYKHNFWGLFGNHSHVFKGPKQDGPYTVSDALNIVHEKHMKLGLAQDYLPPVKTWKILKMNRTNNNWHYLYEKLNLFIRGDSA